MERFCRTAARSEPIGGRFSSAAIFMPCPRKRKFPRPAVRTGWNGGWQTVTVYIHPPDNPSAYADRLLAILLRASLPKLAAEAEREAEPERPAPAAKNNV